MQHNMEQKKRFAARPISKKLKKHLKPANQGKVLQKVREIEKKHLMYSNLVRRSKHYTNKPLKLC